jgi:NAD(P)-dependent dehydrogenase (short-subunit alcohol dehydrogenase family)
MAITSPTGAGPLSGKVALVTGGSRGIGYAIAAALVGQGARAVITGRNAEVLEKAQAALGDGAWSVQADVRNPVDAARAVDETVARFGGIDVLVNNAGVGVFAPIADMTVSDWQRTIETNLSGVFYCCHAAIPHMRRRSGGWIFNISSLAGTNAFAGGAAYCASKAGLDQFSEALMQEVRQENIRVTCIKPGSVATAFGDRGAPDTAGWKIQPDDLGGIVVDLLQTNPRTLPSRIEVRPSKPPQKS